MPANLIPLMTNSGRIFTSNKVTPESDGLVGVVDINDRNKTYLPTEAVFNATGDSLLISDSRNQVTLLQIGHNRFNVVSANLRETPHTVCFTAKQNPQDQVLVVLKDEKKLQLHALNGKLLESLQSNLHHQLEVKSAQVCPQTSLVMTLSNDSCVLWSTSQNSTIKKERSLFAQQGCHFSDAKFSPDGRQVGTLFKDGNIVLWDLDGISGLPSRQQEGQMFKFLFPSPNVKLFDFGQNMLVGAGPQFPYICIKHNSQQPADGSADFVLYKLPKEARGVEQIIFLSDRLLLAYISEGIFYLVDMGQKSQSKLQIACEIRLSGSLIKRFSVDRQMNALALCATNGNVLLYNLPSAIQNDQTLAKKRLQMGIEKELVYTYLEQVDPSSNLTNRSAFISIQNQSQSEQQSQASMTDSGRNDFKNPFLTVNEGMEGLFSQREGARPSQSPLLDTNTRMQIFNTTGGQHQSTIKQLVFPNNDPKMPADYNGSLTAQDLLSGRSQANSKIHFQSEQTYGVPMPVTAHSQTLSQHSNEFKSHRLAPQPDGQSNIQLHPQYYQQQRLAGPQVVQNYPLGPISIGAPASVHHGFSQGIHNISQSTVAGPYQMQSRSGRQSTEGGQPQPIVQLTVPMDRTQTIASNKTMTQDFLIQGMPTALLTQNSGQNTLSSELPSSRSVQHKIEHSIDTNFQPEFKESSEEASAATKAAIAQFNLPKLRRLLKQYGQLPDKYRTLTWKYLLQLPLNKEAFQGLLSRGVHPAFKDLHKRFPVASYRLYNKLVRILSALGHWSPVFLDVTFLPQIVFPFLKVIPNDDLLVFELIMSLIVQWMQVWFEAYPAEPLAICDAIDQIVNLEDQRLTYHMNSLNFHASQYAWPFLTSFFSEALAKDDWLKLMDHLFIKSSEPELLLYFLGAYLLSSKSQLMQIGCVEDLAIFLATPTAIPFKKIMTLAETLHTKHKTSIFPGTFGQNLPVSSPHGGACYQSFTRYPDHFVSFQNRIREKIVNQEEEIQKKGEILLDLKTKASEIVDQEQRLRMQTEAMARAEAERKTKVRTEMENLLQERIRLDELQRKARLEHIQAVESTIKTSLTQQEKMREEEHRQIQEEVSSIQRQQKYEFESRLQDEMIANLEFKANQKLLEQLQTQQQEEHSRQNRQKLDSLHQEVVSKQQESMRQWETHRDETRKQNQMLNHQLQVQKEHLSSKKESDFMEAEFQKVRDEQSQIDQRMSHEQQVRDQERQEIEHILKQREQANQQLIQEKDNQRREQMQQEAAVMAEQAELENLKREELQARERLTQIQDERITEVEKARELRGDANQDTRLEEERQKIAAEKEQILRAREQLSDKEKSEVERRDFMKMIRVTAENVKDIVKDGQRKLSHEREIRQSRESNQQQHMFQPMSHPKYSNNDASGVSSGLVEDVISERQRRVQEQNESLREQLSLQYSQQMMQEQQEKENEGRRANQRNSNYTGAEGDLSTVSQEMDARRQEQLAQRYSSGQNINTGAAYQPQAYEAQGESSYSHFSDESSDVESYHQSKMKQHPNLHMMTQIPQSKQQQYTSQTESSQSSFPVVPVNPHMIQTHLLPQNHQQLAEMPGSKSSVGLDISSSFVSSATESQGNYQTGRAMAYTDMSDVTSMLTSQDSIALKKHIPPQQNAPQTAQMQQQVASQSNLMGRHQALAGLTESQSSVATSSYQATSVNYNDI